MNDASRQRVVGRGYVDHVTLMNEPNRHGYAMVVRREYERVREALDLVHELPWVRFRQILQGSE